MYNNCEEKKSLLISLFMIASPVLPVYGTCIQMFFTSGPCIDLLEVSMLLGHFSCTILCKSANSPGYVRVKSLA